MVIVDQDRIGRVENILAQAPLGHILKHVCRDAFDALRHRGNPQIRPVRDQGRQEGRIEIGDTGRPFVRTAKHPGKITPRIDLEIFAYLLEKVYSSSDSHGWANGNSGQLLDNRVEVDDFR
jgi:hypothetical protein